jgi:hypothetical protein
VQIDASGALSLGEDQFDGQPLLKLTQPRRLCAGLFSHPSRFGAITPAQSRPTDLRLPYPVDEACPISLEVFAMPLRQLSTEVPPGSTFAINADFVYHDLDSEQPVAVQVIMSHGPPGPWPDVMVLVVGE